MNIRKLIRNRTVCIRHTKLGMIHFLSSEGAVFDYEDVDNLLNMSVASAALFDNHWGIVDPNDYKDQIKEMIDGGNIMELQFVTPPKNKPNLTIIK